MVPPVVGNRVMVLNIALGLLEYAQVALSLVVTVRDVAVVPAGSVPAGAGLEIVGAMRSGGIGGGETRTLTV